MSVESNSNSSNSQNGSEDVYCGVDNTKHPIIIHSNLYLGYFIYVLAGVGLVGNLLSLKVLSRPRLRDCFHRLLFSLAIFDTIFLVFGTIKYTGSMHKLQNQFLTIIFPYLTHPFTEIGMAGTIFSTVAITAERYLGICHPMKFPAYTRKPYHYIIPVTILSLMVNLPRFFETILHTDYKTDNGTNTTENIFMVKISEFRYNRHYVLFYIYLFRVSILAVIPFLLLIILNLRIIMDLRRVTVQRFGSQQAFNKEKNLYFVLLSVVVAFILFHTPRIIVDMYETIQYNQIRDCKYISYRLPLEVESIIPVSHFLVILNSSINFLLYCSFGTLFRKECRSMMKFVGDFVHTTNSYHPSTLVSNLHRTSTPHGELQESQANEEFFLKSWQDPSGSRS